MEVGSSKIIITPPRGLPLAECFGRGGYETLPVVGGAPREDTAERLIHAAAENIDKVWAKNAR